MVTLKEEEEKRKTWIKEGQNGEQMQTSHVQLHIITVVQLPCIQVIMK